MTDYNSQTKQDEQTPLNADDKVLWDICTS